MRNGDGSGNGRRCDFFAGSSLPKVGQLRGKKSFQMDFEFRAPTKSFLGPKR